MRGEPRCLPSVGAYPTFAQVGALPGGALGGIRTPNLLIRSQMLDDGMQLQPLTSSLLMPGRDLAPEPQLRSPTASI